VPGSPQERRKSTLTNEDRVAIATQLAELVKDSPRQLTDKQVQWVDLAIQKEAQSIAFRNAVIEKSLAGLVWAAFAFAGYLMLEFLKFKGYKP